MSEFIDNPYEVLALFGVVQVKRMFGGYCVYHDDLRIGLVADEVSYLKADAKSSRRFRELGLPQFEHAKSGKKVKRSCYMETEEIFDDPGLAKEWTGRAYEAAPRAKKPTRKSKETISEATYQGFICDDDRRDCSDADGHCSGFPHYACDAGNPEKSFLSSFRLPRRGRIRRT